MDYKQTKIRGAGREYTYIITKKGFMEPTSLIENARFIKCFEDHDFGQDSARSRLLPTLLGKLGCHMLFLYRFREDTHKKVCFLVVGPLRVYGG